MFKILLFLEILTLISCKTRLLSNSSDHSSSASGRQAKLSLVDESSNPYQKPKVLTTWLLTNDLRIESVQVNTQDFIGYQVPVLSMTLPKTKNSIGLEVVLPDFTEIYRCFDNIKIIGDQGDSLDEIFDTSSNLDVLLNKFRSNNFWQKLSKIEGCEMVATNHSENIFYDLTYTYNPSNPRVRYYLRSCVDPSNIADKSGSGLQNNCSVMITNTSSYLGSSSFKDSKKYNFQSANSIKDKIDTTSRQLYYLLTEIRPKSLRICEEDHKTTLESESQKNARTTISWIVSSSGSFASYFTYKAVQKRFDPPVPPSNNHPLGIGNKISQFLKRNTPAIAASSVVSTSVGYIISAIVASQTPTEVKYPKEGDLCDVDSERQLARKTLKDSNQAITDIAISTTCSCAQTSALDSIIAELQGDLERDSIEFQNYFKNQGADLNENH